METDGLEQKIQQMLSSPESMARIGQLLGSLGGGAAPTPPAEPVSAPPTSGLPEGLDLSRLLPLLSGFSMENDDARLLRALKPYLHGERATRLDGAIRMVQLSQVLPLLKGEDIPHG